MEITKLAGGELRIFQMNLLELLVEVDRICRKNDIEYSLDGGTLLGAVRHKGFIPWDDDADLIFTRAEYNKFKNVCKNDLDTDRFFLQDYQTDKEYRWGYAKLRRKNTEYVRCGQEKLKYQTGICIDIFVVDNVSDQLIVRNIEHALLYGIRKILYSEVGKDSANHYFLRKWYQILNHIPKDKVFKLRDKIAKKNNSKNTKLKDHYLFPYPKHCKFGLPSTCFSQYEDSLFEGCLFRVMKERDLYLTIVYGDYMTPPPPEKQHGLDYACNINMLNLSYEEVIQKYHEGLQK